jgi:hypothetical protein
MIGDNHINNIKALIKFLSKPVLAFLYLGTIINDINRSKRYKTNELPSKMSVKSCIVKNFNPIIV